MQPNSSITHAPTWHPSKVKLIAEMTQWTQQLASNFFLQYHPESHIKATRIGEKKLLIVKQILLDSTLRNV